MGVQPRTVPLGGNRVAVPVLAGAVGAPGPAYPGINQPAAAALVDDALALVAELRNRPQGPGGVTPQQLAVANGVAGYRADRPAAIAAFQRLTNSGTAVERRDRVILPDGQAWPALFSYSRIAAELDTLRDAPRNPHDYVHTGRFDHAAFLDAAAAGLQANALTRPKISNLSRPRFDRMLGFMEADGRLIDVRWMAYMMGTAYWEAARVVVTGHRPNGRPIKQWETMVPIDEGDRGGQRRYARPVKVERITDSHARITEWDGEAMEVRDGRVIIPRGTSQGAAYGRPAAQAYDNAAGTELTFFGRGYVQLTWWTNYALAGIATGQGLALLFDPELAKDPDIAYNVMADGMLTGGHFANGRRLQNYIFSLLTNYTGARAIVNAADPIPTIVEAARVFETALLGARL